MIDLKPALQKYTEERDRPNKVGRYSISQIYAYLNGWQTPEDFIKGEKLDFTSQFRCFQGTSKHKQIEELMKLLGYKTEVKKEMKVGDFTIVGIADYLSDNEVADLKTSAKLYDKAKPWQIFQVKLYCTVFKKDIGKVAQPIYKSNSNGEPTDFYLKEIGSTKRDDGWFKAKMEKLNKFHNKVKKLHEKSSSDK